VALPKGRRAPSAPELAAYDGDVTDLYQREAPPWWVPGSPPPALLAVDTGELSGVALLVAGRLELGSLRAAHSRIDGVFARALGAALDCLSAAPAVGRLVLVEDTHLGSTARTPLAALSAARYAGAVVLAASARGLPSWRVPPGAWQLAVHGRRYSREEGKDVARVRASALYGCAIDVEHEADAALLAYFGAGYHHTRRSPHR